MLPVLSPLLAVFLAGLVIYRSGKKPLRRPYLFSVASVACGFVTVIGEIFVIRKRFFAGDFNGIEDTIDYVLLICIAVAVTVLILNLIALGISYEKK